MPAGPRTAAAPVISRTPDHDTAPPEPAPAAPSPPAGEPHGTVVALPSAQPAVTPPAAIQRLETSNAGSESEGAIRDIPDSRVAELGDRLFEHIRARLRAELLVDRERAGLIGDVR